jgi:hypothetical protein
VRAGVDRIRRLEEEAMNRFSSTPLREVHYEDLVSSPDSEFRRITDFLAISSAEPTSRTLRQNPEPLSQLLRNYTELQAAFRDSPLQSYFDA